MNQVLRGSNTSLCNSCGSSSSSGKCNDNSSGRERNTNNSATPVIMPFNVIALPCLHLPAQS